MTQGNFIYGFKDEKENKIINETSVEIHGEIMRRHFPEMFDHDDMIFEKIHGCATYLGNELQQERVHIMFNNKKYILE